MTFVLNLGVSFAIASITALSAYNVRHQERLKILKYLLRQIVHSPLRFIIPIDSDRPPSILSTSEATETES
jgi:site-specific recombinase